MKWTKFKAHVHPMAVEAVADMFLGLGIEGIEIEDNLLSEEDKKLMFVNYDDDKIQPLDEYRIVAYLDESVDVSAFKTIVSEGLERIREFLVVGSGDLTIEEMPDEDYENKWKEFYEPFRVGSHMVITPIWETPVIEDDDTLIRIDPGLAFGSGTHATTSLCVEYLQRMDLVNKRFVDVGCGSGILGIIAAKFGAKEVKGIDIDENAVVIAKENVLSNNVEDVMTIEQGNLLDNISDQVDVVAANIMADVIIFIASDVKKILQDGGHFIASGILTSRVDEVKTHLIDCGFRIKEIKEQGEWSALLTEK